MLIALAGRGGIYGDSHIPGVGDRAMDTTNQVRNKKEDV